METNINANVGTSLETNHTLDFSDRLYKVAIAFIAVLGVALAGWVFYQFSALPQNTPHEISVSGEGTAYLKPDVALVSFGVSTQAMKSQDAVNQNNTKMNAVIDAIKSTGVQDQDIQTTLYNLTPVYDYNYPVPMGVPVNGRSESSMIYPSPVPGGRTFNGYSLEQQVSVKIRNFDAINSVLDKAAAAGATNIGQLSFTIDNPEVARSEARAKAIENAKEKLNNIASQSGLSIGKLVNVNEGYNNWPQPIYALEKAESGSVAPQIQTGQMEVSVSVTLTYQVK